jgi:hypothetical protein
MAGAELAIDGQIEHREIARSSLGLKLLLIDQTCFGRRGGLAPVNIPLFQGSRFAGGEKSVS